MRYAEKTSPMLYAPETVQRIVDQAADLEEKTILCLAWETALGAQEIAALKWEDVDLPNKILRAGNREVPMSETLTELLTEKPWRGAYVVTSTRGGGMSPMDRVSVSRKVRPLLAASGLPGACLKTLRENRIVRMLQTEPAGLVSRLTGYDLHWLKQLYKKYTGEDVLPPSQSQRPVFSEAALCQALRAEGDTMVTRAVYLSWQGGLSLREAIDLRWRDLDLSAGRWTIAGETRPIPPVLLERLRNWRDGEAEEQPLLRGIRTRTSPDLNFLSRRVSVFMSKYQLDGLSLLLLRGKGTQPEEQEIIWQEIMKRGRTGAGTIAESTGIPQSRVQWHLDQMVSEGKLQMVRGMGYMARGKAVPWEQVTEIIHNAKASDGIVTMKDCMEKTGLSASLLEHYLRKAIKNGMLERVKAGVYQCIF